MNESLHSYLDGEADADALSPETRRDAEAWQALFDDVRGAGAAGAPVGLESQIMGELRAGERKPWSRLAEWWISPRPVRVRPLIGLAAAAAVAALLLLPIGARGPEEPAGASMALVGEEAVYVQFFLEAPDARSVAVAGDFNDWTPEMELSDVDGDGIWSGRLRLTPGVHKYMFVIDDSTWITDPKAERYTEDGFGNRNAVLAITGGAGSGALAP